MTFKQCQGVNECDSNPPAAKAVPDVMIEVGEALAATH
jgi:hypothetical protein